MKIFIQGYQNKEQKGRRNCRKGCCCFYGLAEKPRLSLVGFEVEYEYMQSHAFCLPSRNAKKI